MKIDLNYAKVNYVKVNMTCNYVIEFNAYLSKCLILLNVAEAIKCALVSGKNMPIILTLNDVVDLSNFAEFHKGNNHRILKMIC